MVHNSAYPQAQLRMLTLLITCTTDLLSPPW